MIWKVIRRNISALQMAGYAIAATAGLSIMLCAALFYTQASKALGGDSEQSGFIVVSRPVSALSSLGIGNSASGFTDDDIADLAAQPWADAVGAFTAADFSVAAGVDIDGRGFSTQLFLESVPDDFIDTLPDGWTFDPSDPTATVPVILPRDYLALYNFGFAASRGLPQLSESMITRIPVAMHFSGNGINERRMARIAGFSDRINTIAVPAAFLEWANRRYGNSHESEPSRLIIKANAPGDPAIEKYFDAHNISTSAANASSDRAAYLLKLVSAIAGGVGAAICTLSLFILLLSVALLMQKNRDKNATLLFLGYSPWQVAAAYIKAVAAANIAVGAAGVVIALSISRLWQQPLADMGANAEGATPTAIMIAAGIMAAVTLISAAKIKSSIKV